LIIYIGLTGLSQHGYNAELQEEADRHQRLKEDAQKKEAEKKAEKSNQANKDTESQQGNPILRRAFLSLEDGEWGKADELLEHVLNTDPENSRAYIGKLCVELKINREEDLLNYEHPIKDNSNYKRAVQFADKDYKAALEGLALTPDERRELEALKVEQDYRAVTSRINEVKEKMRKSADTLGHLGAYQIFMDTKECAELIAELERLKGYKDSNQLLIDLSTPIKDGDKLYCTFCGIEQQASRAACFRCGIKFRIVYKMSSSGL
jgi:hypothetical protein